MPYRRLPTTASARLRAMQTALKKFQELGDDNVPFTFNTISIISRFFPRYEAAIQDYRVSLATQSKNSEKFQVLSSTARMYISHFIQVLNLACIRGEIKPDKKTLYHLVPEDNSVPDLRSDSLILEWGKNIIEGEAERLRLGGVPIYNPAIGKVRVHYEQFKDAYQERKMMKRNTERYLEKVQSMHDEADRLILDLWNQTEGTFAELGTEQMQERSKEFGVVYYLRHKERKALEVLQGSTGQYYNNDEEEYEEEEDAEQNDF